MPDGRTGKQPLTLEEIFDGGVEAKNFGRMFALFASPEVLPSGDWELALDLLVACMRFEAKTRFQDGPHRVPCNIVSVITWLKRRERPAVVDSIKRLETHFGDEVACMWQDARGLPADLLVYMHGEGGLSTVVRTLLQWRAVDSNADDWAIIVGDVIAALDVLRERRAGADFSLPLANLLHERDGSSDDRVVNCLSIRASDRARRIPEAEPEPHRILRRGTRVRKMRYMKRGSS
ncbi:unnamed protein product [Peniophora sp. CBMAI 1063]|nr:unnamed protein product [Peniophora sp. CBMAI 1063]